MEKYVTRTFHKFDPVVGRKLNELATRQRVSVNELNNWILSKGLDALDSGEWKLHCSPSSFKVDEIEG